MTLKVAAVGAGYFAQYHYDAWRRIDNVDLVGICDQDIARANSTAEHFSIPLVFDEFEMMLRETKPDVVDIITPPTSHEELVDLAITSGAAIICQKPLAATLADAYRMVAAADAHNVFFAVHENFRFQPWYLEIKKLLDQQVLGNIFGVSFRMRPGDGQGSDAYLNRQPYFQKMERFLIHETGIHFIDTYRYLFGEVRRVYAELRQLNPAIAGEDAGTILFEFDNQMRGLLDANRLVDHVAQDTRLTMGEMLVEGSIGVLRLDGAGRLFVRHQGSVESEHCYSWNNTGFAGDSVFACQSHLIDCLREKKPTPISGQHYLRNLEIEEAIYESSRTGVQIEI
jgi:predicted dehydrogenase